MTEDNSSYSHSAFDTTLFLLMYQNLVSYVKWFNMEGHIFITSLFSFIYIQVSLIMKMTTLTLSV